METPDRGLPLSSITLPVKAERLETPHAKESPNAGTTSRLPRPRGENRVDATVDFFMSCLLLTVGLK
jgi:hypothetical protein